LQIRAGGDRMNHVFAVGAERILARIDRSERRKGIRR
jgi:hypothetical protein